MEGAETLEYNVTPQLPANGYTVAELFAGGGLMAVGLKTAGFNIIWANDYSKFSPGAVKAYTHNIGPHIIDKDVTTINAADIPDTDIIAGGPPCQDYSVAGDGAGEEGERGKLVFDYLAKIEAKQPKAFIFENVKGLIQKKHRHTFDKLLVEFDAIGYNVSWQLVNSWDYGVAQKRERVFIVGIRKDLGFAYEFPQPQPEDYRTQVLFDVIGDLPEPLGIELYPNHSEKDYWTPKSEYEYSQANRVQKMDEPCNTIPAHHNSGQPIHPNRNGGRFTVREALRIQSVPDWYVIPDGMGVGAQYKIVGNGVASRVAWYLGKTLADQLRAHEEINAGLQEAATASAAFDVQGRVEQISLKLFDLVREVAELREGLRRENV